jgi:hypothetical protein
VYVCVCVHRLYRYNNNKTIIVHLIRTLHVPILYGHHRLHFNMKVYIWFIRYDFPILAKLSSCGSDPYIIYYCVPTTLFSIINLLGSRRLYTGFSFRPFLFSCFEMNSIWLVLSWVHCSVRMWLY